MEVFTHVHIDPARSGPGAVAANGKTVALKIPEGLANCGFPAREVAVELAASASRTGKCPECEYPTVGLGSGICPECGWDHDRLKRRLTALRRRYQRRLWTESGNPVHVYFR